MQGGTVAVLAFEGVSPFHLSVPCAVFGADRNDAGVPGFDVKVCALKPGRLGTGLDFDLVVRHGLRAMDRAWLVVVPSWPSPSTPVPPALTRALCRAHTRGAVVAGLCLGAFALAGAGLLDGREATTHWLVGAELAKLYPKVTVRPDVLYLDAGKVVTSAGTAAGIDCCLHLLRQRRGAEAANRVARRMVVSPHRQGGQAQFVELPLGLESPAGAFDTVMAQALATLDAPHSLNSLARQAAMSRRTFSRRFRQVTGGTPARWLAQQRLGLACRLLEGGDLPVERVAEKAGFASAVTLRQQFQRMFGVPPRQWRQRFRGER